MNKGRNRAVWTLIVYCCAIAVTSILYETDSGGPCNPGLGVISIQLMAMASFILFLVTVFTGKNNKSSAFIHLVVFISCIILMFV